MAFDSRPLSIIVCLHLIFKVGSIYFFRAGVTHHSDLKFFFGYCLLFTQAIRINFPFWGSSTFQKRSILEIASRAAFWVNNVTSAWDSVLYNSRNRKSPEVQNTLAFTSMLVVGNQLVSPSWFLIKWRHNINPIQSTNQWWNRERQILICYTFLATNSYNIA